MNETKLTLRTVIDDQVTEVSIGNDRWDMTVFDMADMFKCLLLAAEYEPESVDRTFKHMEDEE